jgi:hypothetical protein
MMRAKCFFAEGVVAFAQYAEGDDACGATVGQHLELGDETFPQIARRYPRWIQPLYASQHIFGLVQAEVQLMLDIQVVNQFPEFGAQIPVVIQIPCDGLGQYALPFVEMYELNLFEQALAHGPQWRGGNFPVVLES